MDLNKYIKKSLKDQKSAKKDISHTNKSKRKVKTLDTLIRDDKRDQNENQLLMGGR